MLFDVPFSCCRGSQRASESSTKSLGSVFPRKDGARTSEVPMVIRES